MMNRVGINRPVRDLVCCADGTTMSFSECNVYMNHFLLDIEKSTMVNQHSYYRR